MIVTFSFNILNSIQQLQRIITPFSQVRCDSKISRSPPLLKQLCRGCRYLYRCFQVVTRCCQVVARCDHMLPDVSNSYAAISAVSPSLPLPPFQDGPELRARPRDAGGAVGVDGVAGQRVVGVRPQREPLHQLHREEEELLREFKT